MDLFGNDNKRSGNRSYASTHDVPRLDQSSSVAKVSVTHRTNQGRFSGAGRTALEVNRRFELEAFKEYADIEESRNVATYLELPSTNAELKKQFMSPSALALKRNTPMFERYE